jgi:hypothetical protein
MSKSKTRSKRPKPGKNSGGIPQVKQPTYPVDTTTALTTYDSYSGEEWISDVVYDMNSENYKRWQPGIAKDQITGWWVKKEVTDETLVTTNLITTKSTTPYGAGKWYVERMVFDLDPSNTQSLRAGGNRFSINNIDAVARLEGRAVSVGEAMSYYVLPAAQYRSTNFPAGGQSDRSYTNIKGGTLGVVSYSTNASDGEWFRNYDGGKFFGKDWYLNPFGNNLL